MAKRGAPKGNTNASKLDDWLEAAKEVLFNDINAIIHTDQDLLDEINERLPEEKRITKSTFQKWKQQVKKDEPLQGKADLFYTLLKKALRDQRKHLFDKFKEDSQWQRWAWIIERKFDEWNIRHKHDVDGDMNHNVTVSWGDDT